jgi:hypothetical protein
MYNKNMLKNYYKPTPVKWRKLGDALLAVALIGIPANLTGHEWIGITLFAVGIVGKFLTNFFTEEDAKDNNNRGRRRRAN